MSTTLAPSLVTATSHLTTVEFDPKNPEHIAAYLALTEHGRQHPKLRFRLTKPFLDVRSMMHRRIGEAYASQYDITKHLDAILNTGAERVAA